MALPSSGYSTATVTNPGSALTDFTLMVDLSRMPADWWSAVDTADGTKGRAAIDSSETELATDWIDFDNVAETGWLRVKWTGTLASTGTQTLRIYPPQAANSSYLATDTFGSDNAYDANWAGYWPLGDANDRTSNGNNLTATGGVVFGGTSLGQVGDATDFDGTDDAVEAAVSAPTDSPVTLMIWAEFPGANEFNATPTSHHRALVISDTSSAAERISIGYETSANGTSGAVRCNPNDGTTNDILDSGIPPSGLNHLAATEEGTAREAFLNGASYGTSSTSLNFSGLDTVTVGNHKSSGGFQGTWFEGILDDAQVHSTARSSDWIAEEYAQTNDQATFWGTWSWTAGGTDVTATQDATASATAGAYQATAAPEADTTATQGATASATANAYQATAATGSDVTAAQGATATATATANQATVTSSPTTATQGQTASATASAYDATAATASGVSVTQDQTVRATASANQATVSLGPQVSVSQDTTASAQAAAYMATVVNTATTAAQAATARATGTAYNAAVSIINPNIILKTLDVELSDVMTLSPELSDTLTLDLTLGD